MNALQRDLFSVICSIVKTDNFDRMYEDHTVRYGLLNYIAKYSLAKDTYLATETSIEYLIQSKFLKEGKLRRGTKSQKNKFTYEHPIPSNEIGREIVKNRHDSVQIAKTLEWSDKVTILTTEENERFRLFKLTQKMPDGWKFFSDTQFARYYVCGICSEHPTLEITMTGQIVR